MMKTLIKIFIFSVLLSSASWAEVKESPEEKMKSYMQKKQYQKALKFYTQGNNYSAEYKKSPNGQALFALLLAKNKFEIIALNKVLGINEVNAIDPDLRSQLVKSFSYSSTVWKHVESKWNEKWSPYFSKDVKAKYDSFHGLGFVNSPAKAKRALKTVRLLKSKSHAQSWLLWQLVGYYAVTNNTKRSMAILNRLAKVKKKPISNDLVLMTKGRIHYQRGELKKALKVYKKISRESDYWLESLEEQAWTQFRLGKPQDSLAHIKTLTSGALAAQVGAEVYFLGSLISLRVCDYKRLFGLLKLFKERQRERTLFLEKVSRKPNQPEVIKALRRLRANPDSSWDSFGSDVALLPRFFHRDEQMQSSMRGVRGYIKELAGLRAMAQKIGSSPEISAEINKVNTYLNKLKKANLGVSLKRMSALAGAEVEDTSELLKKLHVVEVEAIQRLHLLEAVKKKINKKESIKFSKKSSDYLVFPDSGETWLDELDSYEAKIKGCPKGESL